MVELLTFLVCSYETVLRVHIVFSSPELKAQVSYSDRPLSVCLFVNFYIFNFLLQNHCANFNQTWRKSSLGKDIQVSSNEGDCPSPRGDNSKGVKMH
jgi:hypothetical protein